MHRNILLPVEISQEASWRKALPEAARIARQDGAKLHVLLITPDFGMSMVGAYFPEGFEKEALTRARAELDAFLAEHAPEDVEVEGHMGHGHVAEEILRAAKRVEADLIVMASHEPDQLRDMFLGSHADRVVRHAPISVLVVRG
ncbi:MAG: universal stress protein [Pseudomonadota bacterium]